MCEVVKHFVAAQPIDGFILTSVNASISFWVSLVFSTSPDWPLSLTISMMGKSMNGKSPSEVLQEGSIIVMMGSPTILLWRIRDTD